MAMVPSSSTNNSRLHEELQFLKEMMLQLNTKAIDIQNEVQTEDRQAREKRESEVTSWLQQVSIIKEQVQSIETEVEQVSFFHRSRLSKKLQEMVERIEQLLKQSVFPRGMLLDDFKPEGLELVTQKVGGSTPSRVQDAVWSCFERGERRVAIFGIGGVGKTTLSMHINNEILRQKRPFKHVYYVTVSRETTVLKLQSDIAKAVGYSLKYEDEPKRAAELRMALAKREKSLLILDDVWEDITMEEVGVSVEGNGCKLLITTRDRGVCLKMKCCLVHMKPLSADESRDLFKKQLGNYETLPDEVKVTAALVAEECDGLPLGIVTMARSMRGETSVHVWWDALRSLQNPCSSSDDMENKVFRILRYCYDRLYGDKHRKCFLYCALYPEDTKIEREELIRHFIAVGLLDRTNRKESIEEGHFLLNVLETVSLLECATEDWNRRCVKMHDVVRDMAIRIMGSTAMVIERKSLKEILGREERIYKELKWVSLLHNEMDHIEGMMPDCPNISMLFLLNGFLKTVSDSFFVKMTSLKVLNFSCTKVEVLPASISNLCNLTSLMLHGCDCLRFIPSLAKLTNLRELDLNGCEYMRELPEGMEELAGLEHLDLSYTGVEVLPASVSDLCNLNSLLLIGCHSLCFIPSLAKLTKLRELNLKGCRKVVTLPKGMEELASLEHLDLQGTEIGGLRSGVIIKLLNLESFFGNNKIIVPLEELRMLKHLKNLIRVHFEDVSKFNQYVRSGWFNQLETYHVSIGYSDSMADYYDDDDDGGDIELIKEICWDGASGGECLLLPQNVNKLKFINYSFGGGSMLGNLPSLGDVTTDLELWCSAHDCECIIPEWWTKPLQFIQNLVLAKLDEFCGLIREDVVYPYISFSGLSVLGIYNCQKLKKLWMLNLDLPNLEEISIQDCEQMEEIFATERGGTVKLPRLRYLELEGMPELRSIWGNWDIFFPHLESLYLHNFQKMKKIGRVSGNLSSLKTIVISGCKEMEEIFAAEDEAGDNQIHLPKLEKLDLDDLPQLRSISRQTIVCNSLQKVSIGAGVGGQIHLPKMDNCPISVPNLSVINNSGPLPVLTAFNLPQGWWDSLHWNDPATLSLFHQLGCFHYSDGIDSSRLEAGDPTPLQKNKETVSLFSKSEENESAAGSAAIMLPDEQDFMEWTSELDPDQLQNDSVMVETKQGLPKDSRILEAMKDCCSIFFLVLEEHAVERDTLIQLWMAVGYVVDEPMGHVCFDYLLNEEYLSRSGSNFVTRKDKYHMNINKIKANFLDGQTDKANFYFKWEYPGCQKNITNSTQIQHVSVVCNDVDASIFQTLQEYSELRTLLFLRNYGIKVSQIPDHFFQSFKELRALDLSGTNIKKLPSSVGCMKSLCYLDLSATPIEWLPDIICSLGELQTLKLRDCSKLRGLPMQLKRLTNLRHLEVDVLRQLSTIPKGIGALVNLQTLSAFLVGTEEGCKIQELKELNSLTGDFCIAMLENVGSADEAEKAALNKKRCIKKLELRWTASQLSRTDNHCFDVFDYLRPCSSLIELQVFCYEASTLPGWVSDPNFSRLSSITLFKCEHISELPLLERLPSLKQLELVKMNGVKRIERRGSPEQVAFSSLEKLELDEMQSLEVWSWVNRNEGDFKSLVEVTIKDCPEFQWFHVLPCLSAIKHLEIRECPKLESLSNMKLSDSLEDLIVEDCPRIRKKCWQEGGEDWYKIQHVSNISICVDDDDDDEDEDDVEYE